MTPVFVSRLIKVDAVHNIRHLGGYRTADGHETRDDVIRAASLHGLTDAGVQRLAELGVRAIVDLRSSTECERMPTPNMEAHGIQHIFAPVFQSDASPVGLSGDFPGFARIYPRFLERGRNAYRLLFNAIGECGGGVVFHCAAGKDRTGVAAALALELVGVSDDDIVEDYSHSSELLKDAFKDWKPAPGAEPRREISPETREKLLASNPADMVATLLHLRERWGSASGYLEDLGFSSGDIATLRRRLVH